jgi:hypothetical protein
MEIDHPTRFAETPRVCVVCPHLRLGNVESKSPEDASEETGTASCDP